MTTLVEREQILTRAAAEESLSVSRTRGWRIAIRTVKWTIFALLVSSIVIFYSLNILPGDPASIMGGTDATPEQIANIRTEYGWDRPVVVQYFDWIGGVITGDFGVSPFTSKSVTAELIAKLQVTLPLALIALTGAFLAAMAIGILAAAFSRTWFGRLISWISQLGITIPSFVLGIALIAWIAIPSNGAIPATGFPRTGWRDPGSALMALMLPALTLAIPMTAQLTRFVRSALLEQLNQDYMRTARAQGISKTRALLGHALRNAWLPIIAVLSLDAAMLLMGTVVVEQVFALSGVGQSLVAAVSNRDIVTVQGFLMVLSATIIVLMMVSDLVVRLADPRIRIKA
ncbi:MAG: ABC transporter permease [Trueperella sp.]|nr:ABC transporter permease [Trueperella sp.]